MHLYKKKHFLTIKGLIIPLALFFAVVIFFMISFNNADKKITNNEVDTLYKAINSAVSVCYSIEGRYPDSIEYIEEHYGVVIDHDRFVVDYDIIASNIKPTVNIIEIKK